jgi:two-component system response regulator (stage 0 sporulation protein A)
MTNKMVNILLVDNNVEFMIMLKDYIELDPLMRIHKTATNGKDAIDIIIEEKNNIDIILLDLIMPRIDGLGVLEKLKELRLLSDFKIIILTAFSQENVMKQVMEFGIDYFLLKPFDIEVLVNRIRQLFNQQNNASYINKETIKPYTVNECDLKQEVTKMLLNLGIPAHIKGYSYIRSGIILLYSEPELLGAITKTLYPKLAENYQSTSTRVERGMRHAIEVGWTRGNPEFINKLFGKRQKPTNTEFMASIADHLKIYYGDLKYDNIFLEEKEAN